MYHIVDQVYLREAKREASIQRAYEELTEQCEESIKQILDENTRIATAFDVDADTLLKEMVENKFFIPFPG